MHNLIAQLQAELVEYETAKMQRWNTEINYSPRQMEKGRMP